MKICPSCQGPLEEKLTKAGVLVDICANCAGYWLDQGELNFFCKSKKILYDYEKSGLASKKLTNKDCPKCKIVKLHQGQLPSFHSIVEECSTCYGLFFDKEVLIKLNSSRFMKGLLKSNYKKKSFVPINLARLNSLGLASLVTMAFMYSLLLGFVVFLTEANYIEFKIGILISISFVLFQFIFGPVVLDFSLRLFGSLKWVNLKDLPTQFRKDLHDLCKEHKLRVPKIGIIEDGSPQAYTYGRFQRDARLVFSRGMFDLLNEEELKAVLAHELGHIKNWDFIIMSLAQLVPIIFYHLYRTLSHTKNGNSNNRNGQLFLAGLIAYLFYQLSSFIVLFISRLREYHADYFSVRATKNPNALLTALTKIGLGLALNESTQDRQDFNKNLDEKKAIQSMGIMNIAGSKTLLLADENSKLDEFASNSLKEIMKWDLWSPWSTYYEIFSTHPLLSKRIIALSDQAIKMGQEPFVTFDLRKTESYWDNFFQDLFILSLPFLFPAIGLGFYFFTNSQTLEVIDIKVIKYLVLGFGLGGMIRLNSVYPSGRFSISSIAGILKKVRVSPVRSYPVKLKGVVIGRGSSGNIFSEDLVLKDKTGLIYLDHEPFGPNIFFAFTKFDKFKNQEVEVEGWYRRAPVPYVEVKKIKSTFDSCSNYTKFFKSLLYFVFLVIGLII